jgi:hypothetical protein
MLENLIIAIIENIQYCVQICHRVRTVFRFFTVLFFTAIATVTVPFFSLTVRSAKRTEPLI